MCFTTLATQIGIIVQVVGGAWLVYQSSKTAKTLASFKSQLTFDKIEGALCSLAAEVAGGFRQQLLGFLFLAIGSALQLYGTLPCN
jgi:hypothetical protein